MGSTLTNLLFHIIFSTKNRQRTIKDPVRSKLYHYIGSVIKGEGGTLIRIGGTEDHVHILLKVKPAIPLSDLMRKIKANSSKWINLENKTRNKFYWQDGYAAFSVSESQAHQIIYYIDNQQTRHKTLAFKDELIRILEKHNIEYDKHRLLV